MTDSVSIDEQPADHDEQQVEVHEQAQPCEARRRSTSAPVSPMMIFAGGGVPPQEAEAATDERDRDEREVERGRLGGPDAVDGEVAELPVADDREDREAERRRPRGEPVEAVGQVDGVGRRDDDERRRTRSTATGADVPARAGRSA